MIEFHVYGYVNVYEQEGRSDYNEEKPRALFSSRAGADQWAEKLLAEQGLRRVACVLVKGKQIEGEISEEEYYDGWANYRAACSRMRRGNANRVSVLERLWKACGKIFRAV